MKRNIRILLMMVGLLSGIFSSLAQEEENAELYLEEYTDEFQELFFEALKQKGIENYDKSANLLLECKLLEVDNDVIDHELALVYLAEKEYVSALEYGIEALNSQPENYWYLNTLVDILQAQGRTAVTIRERIPYQNIVLKENLASIYYKKKNYSEALKTLKELDASSFTKELVSKIKVSIDQNSKTSSPKPSDPAPAVNDPLAAYKSQFQELLDQKNYTKLEEVAAESLELFPSQPYFYYMLGKALALNKKNTEATRVLESALDFLLDDTALTNNIYRELANAYKALGNLTKANMYLSKIKNGS